MRFQNQNTPPVMAQPTSPSITQCSARYTNEASITTGNNNTNAFSHFGRIHGRKNAGTMSANEACSEGIAATPLPLLSASL